MLWAEPLRSGTELILALIGRRNRQAGILECMEARFGQIGAAVEQSVAAVARG